MAKHYSEVDVSKWNTAHFQAYLADVHLTHYGVQYAPAGGLVAERKLIANYIGTARKAGKYDRATVKAFIDACFREYRPTPQYPGLTFWFMTTYQTRLLQQAELSAKREQALEDAAGYSEEVAEWL